MECGILNCFLNHPDRALTQSLEAQLCGWKLAGEGNCLEVYIFRPKNGSKAIRKSPATRALSEGEPILSEGRRAAESRSVS